MGRCTCAWNKMGHHPSTDPMAEPRRGEVASAAERSPGEPVQPRAPVEGRYFIMDTFYGTVWLCPACPGAVPSTSWSAAARFQRVHRPPHLAQSGRSIAHARGQAISAVSQGEVQVQYRYPPALPLWTMGPCPRLGWPTHHRQGTLYEQQEQLGALAARVGTTLLHTRPAGTGHPPSAPAP